MGVHIERFGTGERILFIHGAGGTSACFRFQKGLEGCETVLVDLPGHGGSTAGACSDIDSYAASVREAMEGNGLSECYLAGHSMGGAIALRLALAAPGLARGLILMATGARLKVFPRILTGVIAEKEKTVRAIMGFAFSKKAPAALVEAGLAEMMASPGEVIHGDFSACDHFDVMEEVKTITLPTLVIAGTDDVLTPPKYGEYLAESIEGARFSLIEGAGHMVMLEKPEETNRAIRAFVTGR